MTAPSGLPTPLVGPAFSSYPGVDVEWLLTDISDREIETTGLARERALQGGAAHYSESLPVEHRPTDEYLALFDVLLHETSARVALAVATVAEKIYAARAGAPVLVSLARAGTPAGILIKRWLRYAHSVDVPHYTISIILDRGIDSVAMDYLLDRFDAGRLIFVDGWTGKGTISSELRNSLDRLAAERGTRGVVPAADLAVIADPAGFATIAGTRDDILIASACLNSTVSGLVSRTVMKAEFIAPGQFHGAKFYRALAPDDRSHGFLDAVEAHFPAIDRSGLTGGEPSDSADPNDRLEPTRAESELRRIMATHGVAERSFVKPGIGETTRVLLRRVPELVLVRKAGMPSLRHIEVLAAQRGVPVVVDSELLFSSVGVIRSLCEK
jgi:Phosphoribosyl transferase (PRTase)/PELOTA RNA binding domain